MKFLITILIFIISTNLYPQIPDEVTDPKDSEKKFLEYLDSAQHYLDLKMPEKSAEMTMKAEKNLENITSKLKQAQMINKVAYYYERNSFFKKALDYYGYALTLFTQLGNDDGRIETLTNLAIVNKKRGSYDKAIEFFLLADEIVSERNDRVSSAKLLNNIGLVYLDWGKEEKALDYLKDSQYLKQKSGDTEGIAVTDLNIGSTYLELGENDSAMVYFKEALTNFESVGNIVGKSRSLFNIGLVHKAKNDYESAVRYILQSLEFKEDIDDRESIFNTLLTIGQLYGEINYIEKATEYFDKAESIARQLKSPKMLVELYREYYNMYRINNDFSEALVYLEKHHDLKDSLFNARSDERINELTVQYETEKKQNEIEYLSKINEESRNYTLLLLAVAVLLVVIAIVIYSRFVLKKRTNTMLEETNEELKVINNKLKESEKELTQLNATKDKFFSIIAHDLKNPIGSFLMISEILAEDTGKLPEKKRKRFIQMLRNNAQNVNGLLENLLTWSRSQTGRMEYTPEAIDINELIEKNCSLYTNSAQNKDIELKTHLNDNPFAYADKNMVDTVIRNLLSNAVKFTKQGGSIKLTTKKNSDNVNIEIEDTGIGIPEEDKEKLFQLENNQSTKGTADESGTGLGLILCKEFIDANNGTIELESKVGKGTKFNISLPATLKTANS